MYLTYVNVNGVPTKVVSWSKSLEEISSNCNPERLVLLIPGNPGITTFYYKFLQTLHKNLGYTVVSLGHAGHDEPQDVELLRKLPPLKGNEVLYNLQGQLKHKVEFIEKYIPKHAKIYLIGHSIGAHIALDLLKNESIKSSVVKCYLMFPTIEDMALTPNGKFFTSVTCRIAWFLSFVFLLFTYLPEFLQLFIVYCVGYFIQKDSSLGNLYSLIKLINPNVFNQVIFMAKDEMQNVKERDSETLEKNRDIIKLYYSASDWWAPVDYCNKLKADIPNIDAEICNKGFMHSFVLKSASEVADMISKWIKSS